MPYRVACRECDWVASSIVEEKGAANWLAGKHISKTGHVVTIEDVETAIDR